MSQVDYSAMSDQELKRYFLSHRDDKAALQVYLERRQAASPAMITKVGDPDFEVKLDAAIRNKLQKNSP